MFGGPAGFSARFQPIALFIFTTIKSILVLPCEIVGKKTFQVHKRLFTLKFQVNI